MNNNENLIINRTAVPKVCSVKPYSCVEQSQEFHKMYDNYKKIISLYFRYTYGNKWSHNIKYLPNCF